MAGEKVLSYNDVLLRESDLDILRGPYYLNDQIIEFYFSYLSSIYPLNDILLVPPSISFWITNCPDTDSLKDFLEPLNLSDKNLVIFPVNDNDNVAQAEGGSHWSLLAFHRKGNAFIHHDSSGGHNNMHARRLFKAVVGFMGSHRKASDVMYIECKDSPQQVNGYDCGLYDIAIAKVMCCWYQSDESKDKDGLWFSAVRERVSPGIVAEMRNEILDLIKSLMVAKQKGRP